MDHPVRTLLYELFVQPWLRYVPWLGSSDRASRDFKDIQPIARILAPSSTLALTGEKAEKDAI